MDNSTSTPPTNGAPRRKQLPQPPLQLAHQRKMAILQSHVEIGGKPEPLPRSTTKDFHTAPRDDYDPPVARKAVQPLSQNRKAHFRDEVPAMVRLQDPYSARPPWHGTYGYSEREPVGKLPLTLVGQNGQQIKAFRESQELITSLRSEGTRPEEQWWRPASARKADLSGTQEDHFTEPLPDVFQRLTDPRQFSGTHKHRFNEDGTGLGLDGRRDDEEYRQIIAGKGTITRDIDTEMDMPNKPILEWERARSRNSSRSSSRAGMESREDVYSRLHKSASNRPVTGDAQYETKQKIMARQYGSNRDLIPRWQSGL